MSGNLVSLDVTGDARIQEALRKLPAGVSVDLAPDLDRGGEEVAREMRIAAPKAFSNLAQSIRMERDSATSRWIGPGMNYAVAVEKGTGPAGGKSAYFPNVDNLLPWVKLRAGVTLRNTRQGTAPRKAQLDDLRDRAWALARYIARAGTKPQPYVAPTATKMMPRVSEILLGGVQRNLQQLGLKA